MAGADHHVFIVDDDQDIRTSLSRSLGKRGFAVRTFESANAFLDAYDGEGLGCVILDHGMPEITGLELQSILNEKDFPLAIIFITGHGGVPESVQAMKGGAVDFLEKPFPPTVLVERIRAALKVAEEKSARRELLGELQARFARLTAREKEIVARIVENPAEVSSKEVGNFLGISPRTVDHHRARILEKLEVKSIAELVDLAARLNPS